MFIRQPLQKKIGQSGDSAQFFHLWFKLCVRQSSVISSQVALTYPFCAMVSRQGRRSATNISCLLRKAEESGLDWVFSGIWRLPTLLSGRRSLKVN